MTDPTRQSFRIERLDTGRHDRALFSCGEPSLDVFLRDRAGQHARKDLSRTFVAVRGTDVQVVGYYTLAIQTLRFETLPERIARRLPAYPVPVVLLGRLATDLTARGEGLGAILLLDALHRILQLSDEVGILAVEVHALNESARTFYLKYGFEPLLDDPDHLYLLTATLRLLF